MLQEQSKYEDKIITIPNILSLFRVVLIPFIIWFYCVKQDYKMTAVTLVLSGITDMVDGFVARHFHMVSNVGKALDPMADKLTQAAMLISLVTRFPLMLMPLVVLVIKEVSIFALAFLVYHKSGKVYGADWHGKIATCLLYTTMIIHVIWVAIPESTSYVLIILCAAALFLSFVLYGWKNLKLLNWNAFFEKKGKMNG